MIPVTSPPVFDNVNATTLQMIIEQVPEAHARQHTDMRTIVDDDVKAFRRSLRANSIQKLGVLLNSLICLNSSGVVLNADWIYIQANNPAVLKVVAPKQQRATGLHSEFQQPHVLSNPAAKMLFVVMEVVDVNCFVGVVTLRKALQM